MRAGVEATGEFEDRKSRFIAQLVHVETEEEASAHQAAVRARHYDARHNVPAWILVDGCERASDDGEPQRTSGLPTLEVLRGAGRLRVPSALGVCNKRCRLGFPPAALQYPVLCTYDRKGARV